MRWDGMLWDFNQEKKTTKKRQGMERNKTIKCEGDVREEERTDVSNRQKSKEQEKIGWGEKRGEGSE